MLSGDEHAAVAAWLDRIERWLDEITAQVDQLAASVHQLGAGARTSRGRLSPGHDTPKEVATDEGYSQVDLTRVGRRSVRASDSRSQRSARRLHL